VEIQTGRSHAKQTIGTAETYPTAEALAGTKYPTAEALAGTCPHAAGAWPARQIAQTAELRAWPGSAQTRRRSEYSTPAASRRLSLPWWREAAMGDLAPTSAQT
jgi:hypothetical protein